MSAHKYLRTSTRAVSVGGRGEGGIRTGRNFLGGGISRKIKKFRPAYGHLQLSISVHQRCYVTFKMHQIHIRRRAPPHTHAGELPTLSSQLGPRARRGGRTNVCRGRHRPSRRHCGESRKSVTNERDNKPTNIIPRMHSWSVSLSLRLEWYNVS